MRYLFLLGALMMLAPLAQAQRFVYVDTEYIMDKLPEYRSAQTQLESAASQWQKEIQRKTDEIEKLYQEYEAERVLLPEDERQKRQEQILEKEQTLNEFRRQKFGPEGELFGLRQRLIKPIQDRVFDAVQQLAKEQSVDFVLDKAGSTTMLFTNARYDRSDKVLELMGVQLDEIDQDQE